METTRFVYLSFVSSAATLLAPGLGLALDTGGVNFYIEPRLEAGVMYYEYQSAAISVTVPTSAELAIRGNFTQENFKYENTMPTIGGGFRFHIDRFFTDLSAQRAINGNDSDSVAFSGSATAKDFYTFLSANPSYDADFDRNEYAISLGYVITDQLSVYAGYKWAKTSFDTDGRGPFSQVAFFNGDFITTFEGEMVTKVDYDFKYDGPFLGLVYGLNVDQAFLKGGLSFSFAVAFLDGEVDIKNEGSTFQVLSENGTPTDYTIADEDIRFTNTFDSEGDTVGLTFGINWLGSTPVERLKYFLGISAYNYKFDADESENPDIEETVLNFKAGIAYAF